jgi:hypothetical protein
MNAATVIAVAAIAEKIINAGIELIESLKGAEAKQELLDRITKAQAIVPAEPIVGGKE